MYVIYIYLYTCSECGWQTTDKLGNSLKTRASIKTYQTLIVYSQRYSLIAEPGEPSRDSCEKDIYDETKQNSQPQSGNRV